MKRENIFSPSPSASECIKSITRRLCKGRPGVSHNKGTWSIPYLSHKDDKILSSSAFFGRWEDNGMADKQEDSEDELEVGEEEDEKYDDEDEEEGQEEEEKEERDEIE